MACPEPKRAFFLSAAFKLVMGPSVTSLNEHFDPAQAQQLGYFLMSRYHWDTWQIITQSDFLMGKFGERLLYDNILGNSFLPIPHICLHRLCRLPITAISSIFWRERGLLLCQICRLTPILFVRPRRQHYCPIFLYQSLLSSKNCHVIIFFIVGSHPFPRLHLRFLSDNFSVSNTSTTGSITLSAYLFFLKPCYILKSRDNPCCCTSSTVALYSTFRSSDWESSQA